jgi:hypothetical protein
MKLPSISQKVRKRKLSVSNTDKRQNSKKTDYQQKTVTHCPTHKKPDAKQPWKQTNLQNQIMGPGPVYKSERPQTNTHTEHWNKEVAIKDWRANTKLARKSVDILCTLARLSHSSTHTNNQQHQDGCTQTKSKFVVAANTDKIYRRLCKKKRKLKKPSLENNLQQKI